MQPTPPELLEAQRLLAAHVGAALCMLVSFVLAALGTLSLSFNLRRTALVFMALYGFVIFWIPSPATLVLGPVILLAAIGGLIYGYLAGKKHQP